MEQGKLNYNELLAHADELQTQANNMQEILSTVRTLFGQVGTGDVWSGTTASANREQFDRLSAKFPEFYDIIQRCKDNLIKIVEDNKAVDRQLSN